MLTIHITRRVAFLLILGVFLTVPAWSLASHRFTDVPDAHIFHNDVAWLADAGVTKGCNPPTNDRFCPDDAVTRGQMAAFMHRFADHIDAADGTPGFADAAGDADTLDGIDSTALLQAEDMARAEYSQGDQSENLGTADEIVRSVSIAAPAAGTVIVSASGYAYLPSAGYYARCSITTGSVLDSSALFLARTSGSTDAYSPMAASRGFPISAGSTLTVNLVCDSNVDTVVIRDTALVAMFFPAP